MHTSLTNILFFSFVSLLVLIYIKFLQYIYMYKNRKRWNKKWKVYSMTVIHIHLHNAKKSNKWIFLNSYVTAPQNFALHEIFKWCALSICCFFVCYNQSLVIIMTDANEILIISVISMKNEILSLIHLNTSNVCVKNDSMFNNDFNQT